MPFIQEKKGNSVTTAENNTQGTNVQLTVRHVEKCGKANHWQSVCWTSKWKQFNQRTKPVFSLQGSDSHIKDRATTMMMKS